MTHNEFLLALQLLGEERYGKFARAEMRGEDAAAKKALEALR